ncbi:MAG: hypothetical protein QNK23_12985 [Crocinitomicaceae bacterium]|nr:hypothetical protein [Crocinitomicaceae bacterium]
MIKTLAILLVSFTISVPAKIDRLGFYRAFESNSQKEMEGELNKLKNLKPNSEMDAYIGALTMKWSQFQKTPKDKMAVFKEGKELLEKVIALFPENGEFRFLRFAIQENSPKILKYSDNIEEDLEIIYKSYSSLNVTLKKVIREYAKQSENLSSSKLK